MIVIMLRFVPLLLVVMTICMGYNTRKTLKYHRYASYRTMLMSPDVINNDNIIRPLGGYERLLSRITPNSNSVSLSHGACYEIKGCVSKEMMQRAIIYCMKKHPILRTYILKSQHNSKLHYFAYCQDSYEELSQKVLETIEVTSYEELTETWKKQLNRAVNSPSFPEDGPQWHLTNVVYSNLDKDINESAWVFCFNHGIDDQGSVNILVNDIIEFCCNGNNESPMETKTFPPSIEDAIATGLPNFATIGWILIQLFNSLNFPKMLPFRLEKNFNESEKYGNPDMRNTFLKFICISPEETNTLLQVCKDRGVKVTYLLSAVMLIVTSAYIQENTDNKLLQDLRLRFLLSVGLRPYASEYYKSLSPIKNDDFTNSTIACTAGAVDYIMNVPSKSTSGVQCWTGSETQITDIFEMAKKSNDLAALILDFVPESVRLFGLGMQYVDILRVVEMDARNTNTMGRGFSCGVSNMGVVKLNKANDRGNLYVTRGYYGTSHSRNGVLCQLSCMTINNSFQGCLQFTSPLTSIDEADIFTKRVEDIMRSIIMTKKK